MKYLGDIAEDATIRGSFNTRQADGTPITLTSGTLAVYKDAGTTELTAGVTLSVDFDSRTGHHVFTIDTSASATYTPGSDYRVVLTAGTVDGTSVAGTEVGSFSIENRYSTPTDISSLTSAITTIDGIVDSILVDTGTTLDTKLDTIDSLIDAIKAKTDQLAFTVANQVDANALTGGGGLSATGGDAL